MENESWIQSISDVEDESRLGRSFLHGMPRMDQMPQPSPVWLGEPQRLGFDGISSAPMSAVWPQSSCPTYLPDTSVSLPSTPAPVGLYQSNFHGQTSREMPHLNTPPGSAVSLSKMSTNRSERKPQLKLDTGSHGYFKENGSVIMNKWFNTSSTQVAPPQLYNVPPPASLASQDSFNDASSVASGQKLRLTPVGLRPARSDFSSSQLSFTSAGDYASQSPQADTCGRKRLPSHASASPIAQRDSDMQDGSRYNSPSCTTSLAPSVYESDSNYAGSSIQSSQASRQPSRHSSRLPSPALSDDRKNAQNAFLIDARAKGMSYKEIKMKGGFTEAESTLRGRHRMLTKDKDNRVRKPEWTDTDIELLKRAVRVHTRGNIRSGKTSWKKVAEYITNNGGTYSFGYATCHNKWRELPANRRRG